MVVIELCRRGADMNGAGAIYRGTSLHVAQSAEMMEVLIEYGAVPSM